jgi:RimJ/RimL family protein N-acetyltransferase
VSLRTARPSDQATLERLRADSEIDHYMGVDGPAPALLWRHVFLGDQSGALADLVVVGPDDRPIGLVSLWDRTIPHEAAEISIWLGRGHRDAGLGTEALRLALRHAFDQLKLHKVYLRVLDYNARAMRAYEKSGFKVEGTLREEMRVDGAWHDLIYMGVLADEFAALDLDLDLERDSERDPAHRKGAPGDGASSADGV